MNVFLDSVRINFQDAPERITIYMAFSTIFDHVCSKGRAIYKTIVDGKDIKFDELNDLLKNETDEFERVDFFTVDEKELSTKFQASGDSFIEIADRLSSFGALLNEGKGKEALSILEELPKTMHKLISLQVLLPLFDISPDIKFGEKSITEYKTEINGLFTSILDVLLREDYIEAMDIAEYELSPLVETLGKGLKEGIK